MGLPDVKEGFPSLFFCVFHSSRLPQTSQRPTQLVSSLDVVSGGTQNACLQTIYSSLGVDSLIFDFNNVEYLNYIHHGPNSLYTCCKVVQPVQLHQEEGKCWKSLVDSSWKSNCFKFIRTVLTLIIYFGGFKTSFVNKPVHKYQIIMINHEC